MRHVVLLMVAVGVVFVGVVGPALGVSTVSLCVPSGEGAAITTPTGGSCGSGTSVKLPAEAKEQEKLISILPYIKYEEKSPLNKEPLIQFSGINLQVVNGEGAESKLNGTGNLIIGYDETPGKQTGSHNLLLGGPGQSDTSYGGIVGGHNNSISGSYASVLGGQYSTAAGYASTITGGYANKTSTNNSTISGGCSNLAGTGTLTINAICTNTADTGFFASILGGTGNQAEAENSTVSGGTNGEASGVDASVTGGSHGKAGYRASTVFGGLEEVTTEEFGVAG